MHTKADPDPVLVWAARSAGIGMLIGLGFRVMTTTSDSGVLMTSGLLLGGVIGGGLSGVVVGGAIGAVVGGVRETRAKRRRDG